MNFEPHISAVLLLSNEFPQYLCIQVIKIRERAAKIWKARANITFCFQVGESVTIYNRFRVNVSSFLFFIFFLS